jgi:hypothetical protein
MVLLKAALIIPVMATSFMFMHTGPIETVQAADPNMRESGSPITRLEAQAQREVEDMSLLEQQMLSRRLRVERILFALDHVADVASHMSPERIASVEPVLTNLAEQTLELNSGEAMLDRDTDEKLDDLEDSVDGLVQAVELYIEPEMTL